MRVLVLVALVACSENPSRIDHVLASKAEAAKPRAPLTFDVAAIDAWVGAEIETRGAVGASLVIVRDGTPVLAKGYGKKRSDGTELVDADTPFALGSVSKQFACAAAYHLVERGELAMSDSVAKYYPSLTRASEIRLDDLGGHTSGYRDYYPMDYVDTRMRAPIEPDALIQRYATMPLDFAPRTRYSYSNTGFVILARIVERVSGMPYPQLLRMRFFEPLGMTTATTTRPANAATGHVGFLVDAAKPAPLEAEGWLFGAADIWASANDLAKWDVGFASGILAHESMIAMTTARSLDGGRSTGYGCGLGVRTIHGELVLDHGGWVGGFWTHNAIVPRTTSAVVLLANDEKVDLGDLHDTIVRLLVAPEPSIPEIAGPPIADVTRDVIMQLQRGALDRTKLGDDLNAHFDDARIAASSPALRALGAPSVTLTRRSERGGWEHAVMKVELSTKTLTAKTFRSPDGKLRQLLLF